jgi:hypothetical protein
VTFNHKNREFQRIKNCIVERGNALFKSSPVDEYHLSQMNSEKVFFECIFLCEENEMPNFIEYRSIENCLFHA